MRWRADSFLVAAIDEVMSKKLQIINNFSWGYETDIKGEVTILGPILENSEEWLKFSVLFQARFSKWSLDVR